MPLVPSGEIRITPGKACFLGEIRETGGILYFTVRLLKEKYDELHLRISHGLLPVEVLDVSLVHHAAILRSVSNTINWNWICAH